MNIAKTMSFIWSLNNDVIYIVEDPYNTSSMDFEEKEYWVYYQLSDDKES